MSTAFTNYLKNLARTIVPSAVGALAAWLNGRTGADATVVAITGVSVTSLYYGVIRFLETKIPAVAWLLGSTPVVAATPASPAPVVTGAATATTTPPAA